jgi:hypothetical protein
MMKLHFGIRTIAVLTVVTAIFCLGYRLGFERGDKNRVGRLDHFIQSTIGNGQWQQFDGHTSMGGGVVLTTDGCRYYDIDASGNWTPRPDPDDSVRLDALGAYGNPFADVDIDEDPFR